MKWAADTSEFTKADVLERYQAYELASKNGFLEIDEIRYRENLKPLGLDFVKLGLQDVLYYPGKKGLTYVPNMNQVGSVKLAMEDRKEAKKQKDAELEAMKQQTPPEPQPEQQEQDPAEAPKNENDEPEGGDEE